MQHPPGLIFQSPDPGPQQLNRSAVRDNCNRLFAVNEYWCFLKFAQILANRSSDFRKYDY
jgi:hypothetical protein